MKAVYYITEFLRKKRVGVVFDYPGNAVLSLYEALEGSEIRHFTVRHEQGAVHAAEGYAKSGGEVGVCFATSGPGATNLVTGLCDAMLDSVPVIAITGQVDRSAIGHDAFQEADIMGITLAVTKHNFLVKDPLELPTVLEEAWRIATSGRKGPVLIDIPRDVLESYVPEDCSPHPVLPHKRSYKNDLASQSNTIYGLISDSSRPVIICGGGVVFSGQNASAVLGEFSKKNNIPVVYTMMGKSGIDNRQDNVFGMLGLHGCTEANAAVSGSDLVIAIGCRFSDRSCPDPEHFSDNRTVIHADIDAAELCKNVYSACPVVTDAGEFISFLSENDFSGSAPIWKNWLDALSRPQCFSSGAFSARGAIGAVAAALPEAIFVTDVGKHQLFAAQACLTCSPGSFICSGGLGTMGFGLPAAIGASIANPDRKIVLISGDGSIQMCIQELATLRSYNIENIKIIIIDNASLGLVEQLFEKNYPNEGKPFNVNYNPDFSLIAAAYGLSYEEANSIDDLLPALSDGSAGIIRIITDRDENAPLNDELKGEYPT